MPVVKVDVPGTARDPLLIAAHLKSASEPSDLFQRTVEMRRLTDTLNSQGLTPNDNYIVMGDFNLSANDEERRFNSSPGSGLPSGFNLGADIVFPITYHKNPLRYFNGVPVVLLDPRQLDQSPSTINTGSTLDLMLVSPILAGRPMRTEVYNSALDSSNSTGIPKIRSATCGRNQRAGFRSLSARRGSGIGSGTSLCVRCGRTNRDGRLHGVSWDL